MNSMWGFWQALHAVAGVSGGSGMRPVVTDGCVVGGHKLFDSKSRVDIVPLIPWGAKGRRFLACIADAEMGCIR